MSRIRSEIRHFNIPIFIPHLGCPYDCIYCDQKIIANQQDPPTPNEVINKIESHLLTIPENAWIEVAFFGGSFTAVDMDVQEEYLSLVQPYIKQGRVKEIRISTRPDCINEANLKLLKEYGVRTIELGVQSLSDEVLKASGRLYSADDVYRSCEYIKEDDFQLGIQLMIGLPGDSHHLDMETARKVAAIRPQAVRIYPTLVLTGTKLDMMWKSGSYLPLNLQEAIHTCKDMLLLFNQRNIPVIRIGLYPGEELRKPDVIQAGPFHSSFGELVEQQIFLDQANLAINRYNQEYGFAKNILIQVHYKDISKMIGWRRENILKLQKEFMLESLSITGSDQFPDSVAISRRGKEEAGLLLSREEYIQGLNLIAVN